MGHHVYTLNPLVMIIHSEQMNLYDTQTHSSNTRGRTLSVGLISGLGQTNKSIQKTELKRKLFDA